MAVSAFGMLKRLKEKKRTVHVHLKRSQDNKIKTAWTGPILLGNHNKLVCSTCTSKSYIIISSALAGGPALSHKYFFLLSCSVKAVRRVTLEQIQICRNYLRTARRKVVRFTTSDDLLSRSLGISRVIDRQTVRVINHGLCTGLSIITKSNGPLQISWIFSSYQMRVWFTARSNC